MFEVRLEKSEVSIYQRSSEFVQRHPDLEFEATIRIGTTVLHFEQIFPQMPYLLNRYESRWQGTQMCLIQHFPHLECIKV